MDSDSDYSDGNGCPSDDELPPSDGGGDDSDEVSGSEEEAEEKEVTSGGAKKASKKKAAKKKPTKAEQNALKDAKWIDLVEDEQLPELPTKEEFTGPSEKGGPSKECKRGPGDHPVLYFQDMGFDEDMMLTLANNSNLYASGLGAGTKGCFPSWEPFTAMDMKIGISLLIRNGLVSVPEMRLHWTADSFVYGDDRVKKLWPMLRWLEFKALFHIEPPLVQAVRTKGDPEGDALVIAKYLAQPLRKCEPLLSHVRRRAVELWVAGRKVSLDEQTIGFQGKSKYKMRIRYKRTGDGFQCDAICEDGYTYCWYFRFDTTPTVEDGASPLHSRSLYLMEELKHEWHTVYCDNLYTSHKFAQWCKKRKVHICGTVRTNRGIPPKVVQKDITSKKGKDAAAGTLKVAHAGDGTVAFSLFDPKSKKPFHMLSTAHSEISKVKVAKKHWEAKQAKVVEEMQDVFNIVDDYNANMNSVDCADQLRLNYYPAAKWVRMRKWWWSIFIWIIGTATTNSYLIHCKIEKLNDGKPLTHRRFLEMLCTRLVQPPAAASGATSAVTKKKRAPPLTTHRLDTKPWADCRLSDIGPAEVVKDKKKKCSWCRFKKGLKDKIGTADTKEEGEVLWTRYCSHCDADADKVSVHDATMFCNGCKAHFCSGACFREFHFPGADE